VLLEIVAAGSGVILVWKELLSVPAHVELPREPSNACRRPLLAVPWPSRVSSGTSIRGALTIAAPKAVVRKATTPRTNKIFTRRELLLYVVLHQELISSILSETVLNSFGNASNEPSG
jgi:hypothetical protein